MTIHPYDRTERKPLTCIWEITRACNLRCVHCENRCGPADERKLSFEALLQNADALASLGCRTVDITGGEPLLREHWDRLCRHLHELGINVALITNGQKTIIYRFFDEGDFMRRSNSNPNGDGKTTTVCDCDDLGILSAFNLPNTKPPFLRLQKSRFSPIH
jgi:organic radical activating enzyme